MPTDRQRREAERRRLQRQLQRRREREAARRRFTVIASVLGSLLVVALVFVLIEVTSGSGPARAKKTPQASSSSKAAAAVHAYPCTWTKSGAAARAVTVPPTTMPPRTGTATATVSTNRGTLTFVLNRSAAPCAVESFVSLAAQKYFDKSPCHRLTSGSLNVLQCGDPTGTGSGGPGYSFADELTGKESYTRGVLAMANSGPNTNGSQFFLVYKDSQLGPQYTIFGAVTKGLGVLDTIAAGGETPSGDGKPTLATTITTVRVAR